MANAATINTILSRQLSEVLLNLIDKDLAQSKQLLPLQLTKDGVLHIATSESSSMLDRTALFNLICKNAAAKERVKYLKVHLINRQEFMDAFELNYNTCDQENVFSSTTDDNITPTTEQVELVDTIFDLAISMKASDIHIIPRANDSLLQFRIHNRMRTISNISITRANKNIIVNIIKNRCNPPMDVTNKNIPLDGAMNRNGIEFRVSTVPAIFGEKVVVRVFDTKNELKTLDNIGFNQSDVNLLKQLCRQPSGMILMTGPTGSGKTTTLYACLREINPYERSIFSIENPVEQKIPGITQVQIKEVENNIKANLSWNVGMKAALRQDPDVVLLGEIRDEQTALAAVQASQSGHLLFSTLHTNGAIESIERMINFGVQRRAFLSQISCILAQRLVEKLCPNCKKEYRVTESDMQILRSQDITKLNGNGNKIYHSLGCTKCNNTGVIGRIPVFEVVVFDNTARDFFTRERGLVEAEKFLRNLKKYPFRSLWDKSLDLVLDGKTSLTAVMEKINVDEELNVRE